MYTFCYLKPLLLKWISSVVLNRVGTIKSFNEADARQANGREAQVFVLFDDSYTCKWIENGVFYILYTSICHKIKMVSLETL